MSKKIILSALAGFLILPLSAAAKVERERATSSPATGTPALISNFQKTVKGAIAKCPVIESKIQAKLPKFDNAKLKHLAVYDNLKARLAKIADRLAGRGADVAALRADLAVLDTKIAKFSADYAIYIEKLKLTQGSVCGKPSAQFKTQMKETKAALAQVHKDAADIRSYFVSTIRVEIMRLKETIRPATTTPETATSTKESKDDKNNKESKKIKPIVPGLPKLD